ncbi:MAG: tetratricopeptide repeat protein [Thermodesulfobacteria bacterium]|nr:tetratricopeptide repeat protein [Thermodesulfobacteriota bacterium]
MEIPKLVELEKKLLEESKEIPEKLKKGYKLCVEAHEYLNTGRMVDAIELLEEALLVFQENSALKELANVLDTLGDLYHLRGSLDRALKAYKACLDVCEEEADEISTAVIAEKIAHVYREKKDYDRMLPYLYRMLEIAEKFGDAHRAARALAGIGDAYKAKGNIEAAKDAYSIAYKIYKGLGAGELADIVKKALDSLSED